jgi:hypothetical protein
MIKKLTLILGLAAVLFTGCAREEDPYIHITDADVFYDYYSDRYGTSIDGEIINDGETYIEAVQLEIRLYDIDGYLIDFEYVWIDTYFSPGESIPFFFEFSEPWVYDVDVDVHRYE